MYELDNSPVLVAGKNAMARDFYEHLKQSGLTVDFVDQLKDLDSSYDLIFIFTADDMEEKCLWINHLKSACSETGLLCVNIDGIGLCEIQEQVDVTVLGVNFCYPVSASPFMEIVSTEKHDQRDLDMLQQWARDKLNKDPYVVRGGISARAYMFAAMSREAFYLVDEGYASIKSIDRACRNDAGYYMPFTGNYLYMDLMGTVAYAMVMKDLNPDLSNSTEVPEWFKTKVERGEHGMEALAGLYRYKEGDFEKWNGIVKEFSNKINDMITRYKKEYAKR